MQMCLVCFCLVSNRLTKSAKNERKFSSRTKRKRPERTWTTFQREKIKPHTPEQCMSASQKKMQIMQNRREWPQSQTACGGVSEICSLQRSEKTKIGCRQRFTSCSLQKAACHHSLHIHVLHPSVWLRPLSPSLSNRQTRTRLQVVACAGRKVTSFPPRLWVTDEPFSLFKAPFLSCPPPFHSRMCSETLPGLSAPLSTANWAALRHKEHWGGNYSPLYKTETKMKCLSAQVGFWRVVLHLYNFIMSQINNSSSCYIIYLMTG